MDEPQTIEHIGQAIRQLRLQSGWTQTELAEKVGMAPENISQIENGKEGRTNMKLDTVASFARAFNYHPGDLLLMVSIQNCPEVTA